MAQDLSAQVASGRLTWAEAAERARELRNSIMTVIRGRSTPVGRAIATQLKQEGRTLNELIARKATQLFGPNANFSRLSQAQQNAIYAEIIKSAGKGNPSVDLAMRRLSYAGRGLLFISLALAVFSVATSENKVSAAGREAVVMGAGVSGGIAGGVLAGLACGPGAPVCVAVGAFVVGGLAAFGAGSLW